MKHVQFSLEDKETLAFKKEFDSRMIEVLKAFVDICDAHNLRYVLGYGSVLGAVRHDGIIPWDDDIDVCMPRPDYDKFLEICDSEDIGDYETYVIGKQYNYIEPYAKFVDKNSTLLYDRRIPYVCGVMIDIFPIDGADDDETMWQKYSDRYNSLHDFHHILLSGRSLILSCWFAKKGLWKFFFMSLVPMPYKKLFRLVYNKMKKIEHRYSYEESEMVTFYHRVYGYKERIPKRWIEDRIMHKFESIEVYIPKEYDEYLTHFYGNYMEIPPIEKRDKHSIEYINLYKRESFDEIMKNF